MTRPAPDEDWPGPCNQCGGFGGHSAGCTGHKEAPSGQQAEPTELLRAMVGWYSTHGTLHHSDVMGKAKAFLAGQHSERPAPAGQAVGADEIHLAWRGALKACGVSEGDRDAISQVVRDMLAASQAERPAVKERNPSPKGMSDE